MGGLGAKRPTWPKACKSRCELPVSFLSCLHNSGHLSLMVMSQDRAAHPHLDL